MINATDAYFVARKNHPGQVLSSCLDFGSFFLFIFKSVESAKGETIISGNVFDAVEKESGKLFKYDISTDPDAFFDSTEVSVETELDADISKVGDKDGKS